MHACTMEDFHEHNAVSGRGKFGVGAAPKTLNLCNTSSVAVDIHGRRTFTPCYVLSPFLIAHPSTTCTYLSSMLVAYAAPRRVRAR